MSVSSNDNICHVTEASAKWEYLYVADQRLTPTLRNEVLQVKVCTCRCYLMIKTLCQKLKLPPAWVKHIFLGEVHWNMKEKNGWKTCKNIEGKERVVCF